MISGLTFLLIGSLLTWVGWRHWRYRKEETISVLEATIFKATGSEPLPRTNFDRLLTYAQAALGFVLGPFFFLLGFIVLAVELGLV